ncbi:MAG: hypothetical protein XD53_0866 [Petrotoga mobilis]|nr:MAG: hypothetical protein XD53_0866 [Petrotoga mobilis]
MFVTKTIAPIYLIIGAILRKPTSEKKGDLSVSEKLYYCEDIVGYSHAFCSLSGYIFRY